ncbi:MAG TPA: metallopeptidase family protein [Thermoleophilia bacterium]
MELEAFESLVAEAVDSLPAEFLERLENVEVVVEEWPGPEELLDVGLPSGARYGLLGLYHGVPQTERGLYYMALPDRISIYKGPIESVAGNDADRIKDQVRRTVIHEIAHYYGISDERLQELGWA